MAMLLLDLVALFPRQVLAPLFLLDPSFRVTRFYTNSTRNRGGSSRICTKSGHFGSQFILRGHPETAWFYFWDFLTPPPPRVVLFI